MTRMRKRFLPVALVASLLHGLVLAGCGGGSSSTGPSGGAQVRLILNGLAPARVAGAGARSASAAGATVLVDGIAAGVTDASGEIVLQLEPGSHTITVESGGVTSSPFQVTVAEGEVLTLEAEIETDGTLVVEQDIDHDGDYDDDDDDDVDVDDVDDGDDDAVEGGDDDVDDGDVDDDHEDEDEEGESGHNDGTVATQ